MYDVENIGQHSVDVHHLVWFVEQQLYRGNHFAGRECSAGGRESPFSRPCARIHLAELESGGAGQTGEGCGRIRAGHHCDCGIDGLAACRRHSERAEIAWLHHGHSAQLASTALRPVVGASRHDAQAFDVYLA